MESGQDVGKDGIDAPGLTDALLSACPCAVRAVYSVSIERVACVAACSG